MLKKIAFYVFIAVSLAAAVWGYFRLRETKEPQSSVLEHIPADAVCVIESNTSHELVSGLTRQNLIWNSLQADAAVAKAQAVIRYLDSLITSHAEISAITAGNPVYISFLKDGKAIQNLIQFKFKEQNNEALFSSFFSSVFIKNQSVSSFEAYDVKVGGVTWLACYKAGIVYFSSDLSALQNALQMEKSKSMAENSVYLDLLKQSGNQAVRVYFNHQLSGLFDKRYFSGNSLFSAEVELNTIAFTGITKTDSSSYLSVFNGQQAGPIRLFEFLPDNPVWVQGLNLSNTTAFYDNRNQHFPENADRIETSWQMLADSALYDIRKECLENINAEIVNGTYYKNNHLFELGIMKLNDADKGMELLKLMTDSMTQRNDAVIGKVKSEFDYVFGFFKQESSYRYLSLKEDLLYLISDSTALGYYNECMAASKLLSKNETFMQYAEDNLFQTCNFLYYENCSLISQYALRSLFNYDGITGTNEVVSDLSYTATYHNGYARFRMQAMHAREKTAVATGPGVLWSYTADAAITGKVYEFANHLTGETELCFQDEANTVYLTSATGNLLWKKALTEPIRSAIFTVDIFKNGKHQLLFNTDNYLHLLDRNGNYVQGYPVKMPARITSPITLLDYDKNKDYRLFIACADHKIYNYTLYGVKTEGFVPVKTESEVRLPVNYIRVGASDYLITADTEGQLYVFSRKGEGRIDLKNKVIKNLDHLYVQGGNSIDNTRIIYVDDESDLLEKITLSDKKEVLKLGDELSGFKAGFELLDDDQQPDILMYGNGAVYAYDLFSNKLLESYNEQAVYEFVKVVSTENSDWLVAYDRATAKINLINKEGKTERIIENVSGIPLLSNLYKNGKMYLLSINGNRLSCQEIR